MEENCEEIKHLNGANIYLTEVVCPVVIKFQLVLLTFTKQFSNLHKSGKIRDKDKCKCNDNKIERTLRQERTNYLSANTALIWLNYCHFGINAGIWIR